jgi:hypothetical protein
MFRPFHCPKKLRTRLPQWFIPLLFREKPVMIPPIINSSTTSSVRNEYWILVNGIGTNQHMAQQSQEILQRLFGRPCWLYYIPTNSLWFDLLYKFVEDRVGWTTPQQPLLFQALHNAIVQAAAGRYERVVLITHASGVRTTLQELHDMDPHFSHLLQRFLEVYTLGGPTVPHVGAYLEHLVNGRDSVAWRFGGVVGSTVSVSAFLAKCSRHDDIGQRTTLQRTRAVGPFVTSALFRAHDRKGGLSIQSAKCVPKWTSRNAGLPVEFVLVEIEMMLFIANHLSHYFAMAQCSSLGFSETRQRMRRIVKYLYSLLWPEILSSTSILGP